MTSRREWSSHPLSKSTEWNQHAKYVMWKSLPWLIDCSFPVSDFSCQLCYHQLSGNTYVFFCSAMSSSVNDPNFLWTDDNYKIITDYVQFVHSTYIFYHSNQPNGKKSVVQVLSDDYLLLTFAPILEWLWCWPPTYIIAFFSAVCVLLTCYWLIDCSIVHWDVCHMRSAGNISPLSQL